MARRLADQNESYELKQLGFTIGVWKKDCDPLGGADMDVTPEDLSNALDGQDQDNAARPRGPKPRFGARSDYHGDQLEERRASIVARDPNVVTSVAPYLRESREEQFAKQFQMAGDWRVRQAHRVVLGTPEDVEHYRKDFLLRTPNPEMIRDVEENRSGTAEPEWYTELHHSQVDKYIESFATYNVHLDGHLVDGGFDSRAVAEAQLVALQKVEFTENGRVLDGEVVLKQIPLPEPVRVLHLVDEAEPSISASMAYVRADPALMSVALGVEGPLPPAEGLDPGGVFNSVCRRLGTQHEELCRTHPAESRAREEGWAADRAALRDNLDDASQPELSVELLDQMDEIAKHNAPIWEHLRYEAAVVHAAGLSDEKGSSVGRELSSRLADETFPDFHAGVALVDPASPVAVRPAGAGTQYDRDVLRVAEAAVVGGCTWDWTLKQPSGSSAEQVSAGPDGEAALRDNVDDASQPELSAEVLDQAAVALEPPGQASPAYWGWQMAQDVHRNPAQVVSDVLQVQQSHELSGRLSPDLTGSLSAVEAQSQRAAAAVVDVLSALEKRGVWVEFQPVDQPQASLEADSTGIVLPERWRSQPAGYQPLESDIEVSDLERLASGALELRLPDLDATRDVYRAAGMASYRVVTAGEVGFSGDHVLEKVRDQLGSSQVELDRRRLEHFASRMADSSWGRVPEVSGSPKPWTAPGRVASQSEVLDDLLDRAAGVEARVVTSLAARQADSHFRLRELARSSVERFAVAVDRVPAAGLVVQKAPAGQVAYQPDARSLPVQRNAATGPPEDRVVLPKPLLDHRQPAPQSLDGQRRFYEAVVAAAGHPGRRERADAVTVARSLAGRDVPPARLEAASRREQVLVGCLCSGPAECDLGQTPGGMRLVFPRRFRTLPVTRSVLRRPGVGLGTQRVRCQVSLSSHAPGSRRRCLTVARRPCLGGVLLNGPLLRPACVVARFRRYPALASRSDNRGRSPA